jgi:hypothetical protein
MMDVLDRLRSMTAEDLAPIVQRALGIEGAWPSSWSCTPLSTALVNPVTVGLFRLEGEATVRGQSPVPWIVVLKVVADVDFAGSGLADGYSQRPEDWNYWNREAVVYRSGFLDHFKGPLTAVRCLGDAEVEAGQSWLWLEALDGAAPRSRWSLPELAHSAYDLGAFAAQGVSQVDELESYDWAARRWLRGWVRSIEAIGAEHARDHAGCWQHPLLATVLPRAAHGRYRDLMADAARLLDLYESLPRTVAHQDTQGSNLFRLQSPRGRPSTVAIDWSFVGSAPVGHDLGSHLAGNIHNRVIDPFAAAEHDATATDAYLRGLRDFGWSGDERQVLFARAAAASLQIGTFYALHLSRLCPEAFQDEPPDEDEPSWPEEVAHRENVDIADVMSRWCAGFDYMLHLGDEARRLARTVR